MVPAEKVCHSQIYIMEVLKKLYTKFYEKSQRGYKMTVWEKPELTSSHKHNTSTATYGIMFLERDLKTR